MYVSLPQKKIVGYFTIKNVVKYRKGKDTIDFMEDFSALQSYIYLKK
jgi:predicted transcriptional regulator